MLWSRQLRPLLGILLVAGLLTGCGFRPLYKQTSNTDTVKDFSQISVAQPEDRPSQQLRNYLLDTLTPHGQPDRPLYRLEYRLTESLGSVLSRGPKKSPAAICSFRHPFICATIRPASR